jgi:maleate cis-trans isomerase
LRSRPELDLTSEADGSTKIELATMSRCSSARGPQSPHRSRIAVHVRFTLDLDEYIEGEGIEVLDGVALEVPDNLAVGRLDPQRLPEIARGLRREGADAIVLSACVQMPSLPAVQQVEDELGLPVLTAATGTAYGVLIALGQQPAIAGAGRLLNHSG